MAYCVPVSVLERADDVSMMTNVALWMANGGWKLADVAHGLANAGLGMANGRPGMSYL